MARRRAKTRNCKRQTKSSFGLCSHNSGHNQAHWKDKARNSRCCCSVDKRKDRSFYRHKGSKVIPANSSVSSLT